MDHAKNSSDMTQLICDKSFTLIHYLGDESVANYFPHGNSMKEGAFIRTCPSVLNMYRSLLKIDRASVVYKNEVATAVCDSQIGPVFTPRNIKQLRNLRFQHLNHNRLFCDAL